MVMRVATFAANERMLSASLRTQAKMSEMQLQEASGQISTDYGGLGTSATRVLNLEVSLARSKTYATAADEANGRVEVMYDQMSTMTDVLTELRSRVTAAIGTNSTDTSDESLATAAASALEDLAGLLNVRYEGRYLFAGSATTTMPVDLDGYDPADLTTADTSYYQGNGTITSVQVSSERSIAYGVTASNPAFEEMMRAVSALSGVDGDTADSELEAMSTLLVSALDKVTAVQSGLSLASAALERAAASEQEYQSFVSTALSGLTGVDVAAVTVQLTAYETQLQASYAAVAKVQGLSLLDYLR
jgi:flagellar hook-associated protein 3 FlgL